MAALSLAYGFTPDQVRSLTVAEATVYEAYAATVRKAAR